MKALRNFSRIFIGLIFIYSGFVKVIDPVGFGYKINDYLVALNLDFLSELSLLAAVMMALAELVIGILLTFNLIPKISAWAALLFMTVFTPLTLWLAIANPISDCGCFGDALILTNWQTFFKNVIIDVFVIIIFVQRKKFGPTYSLSTQWGLGITCGLASLALSLYCLYYLPIIDFRPYHIGANIQEGMIIPESEKDNIDVIESTFIYEKDGKIQKFSYESIPSDPSWKFIDAEHKVIKEGYKPPIHDFTIEPLYLPGISPEEEKVDINLYDMSFTFSKDEKTEEYTIDMLPDNTWQFEDIISEDETINPDNIKLLYISPDGYEENFSIHNLPTVDYVFLDAEYKEENKNVNFEIKYGEDITPYILEQENYVFLLISTHVEDASTKNMEHINNIADFCKSKGYGFYCLTSSNEEKIREFANDQNTNFNYFNTDPITLKTIIRSNPGLLLLKKGTILNKWSYNDLPETKELQDNLAASSISKINIKKEKNLWIAYLLGLFLFMSIFHNLYNWLKKNKFIRAN
ncbi:DoxX family protein [Bacteroidales bacterium OttesenSCG-928-I21]|nr:DoxX family protein [Bacteroidales bacterium OttesenSCG-928-I21]